MKPLKTSKRDVTISMRVFMSPAIDLIQLEQRTVENRLLRNLQNGITFGAVSYFQRSKTGAKSFVFDPKEIYTNQDRYNI